MSKLDGLSLTEVADRRARYGPTPCLYRDITGTADFPIVSWHLQHAAEWRGRLTFALAVPILTARLSFCLSSLDSRLMFFSLSSVNGAAPRPEQ